MENAEKRHRERIVDQFSKQAVPFAKLAGHLSGIPMLVELSGAHSEDVALDVASGPGLVACAFAPRVRHIEGIDITEAMIEQARKRQEKEGLKNISWRVGTADPLPYDENSFSLVVTRFTFHHFLEPRKILQEMIRVCRPGGRILVSDVALPQDKVAAYDRMEKMRDPSHAHALTIGDLDTWFSAAGLTGCRQSAYSVDVEMEAQLRASFPAPGDEARLRGMIQEDIGRDALGIKARRLGTEIHFSYPVSVFVGEKPL